MTAPSWTPPLAPSELSAVLAKLRQWTPFDSDAVLEDVGAVLEDVVPREEDLDDHARHLRGHLMRFVDVGHLRRMAWSVNGLLERLTALRYVRGAA